LCELTEAFSATTMLRLWRELLKVVEYVGQLIPVAIWIILVMAAQFRHGGKYE